MIGNLKVDSFATSLATLLRPEGHVKKVEEIRECWRALRELTASELLERCETVRSQVSQIGVDNQGVQANGLALMAEGLRRACGVSLYDVQLQAACVLARGGIAEMQTGEGKTYSCAPPAFLHALTGRGVHVATTNAYLAKRDFELLQPAYQLLGLEAGLLPERVGTDEKREAYWCDVTYGTGSEFGFDYLRDQMTLRATMTQRLGRGLLDRLSGKTETPLIQRGLYYSIIDEADNVMLDDAVSPLVLSAGGDDEAEDAVLYRAAMAAVDQLIENRDYTLLGPWKTHRLTEEGVLRVNAIGAGLPIHLLRRTWQEYVGTALRASQLQRNVDYVIDDQDQVQIVDGSTGRIFEDRTWKDGLHQAVEAKEGLRVSSEKGTMAQITRQRFGRLYERLAGTTGTAAGCEREFRQVYGLATHTIALRTPSQREIWRTRSFVDQPTKWNAIAASVVEIHATGRPVLVGTSNIRDSEHLATLMQGHEIDHQILNGCQDAEEAAIVELAGQRGAITIATSLAGRGTDIKLGPGVRKLGGLHVIVAQCNESARVDRQLVGRCGRQGDPGSAQAFLSAQDDLVVKHGPWLAESIQRNATDSGECTLELGPQIRRIQRGAERIAFAQRAAMFRRDLANASKSG